MWRLAETLGLAALALLAPSILGMRRKAAEIYEVGSNSNTSSALTSESAVELNGAVLTNESTAVLAGVSVSAILNESDGQRPAVVGSETLHAYDFHSMRAELRGAFSRWVERSWGSQPKVDHLQAVLTCTALVAVLAGVVGAYYGSQPATPNMEQEEDWSWFCDACGAKVPYNVDVQGCPDCLKQVRPLLLSGKPMTSMIQWYSPPRRAYSRRELLADRSVNFLGAGLSWVGAVFLARESFIEGDSQTKQIGFWAAGLGAIMMLNCSAVYHYMAWRWDLGRVFLSLDHCGISAMIMGTYAPLMLQVQAYRTLAVCWLLGLFGWLVEAYRHAGGKAAHLAVLDKLNVARYLIMGWCCVPIARDLAHHLPLEAQIVLISGGLLYTAGVYFHLATGIEFHMAIWHTAVFVASLGFFLGNFFFLVGLPVSEPIDG